tara:strand:- start:2063 stop:2935 length:873 start_codon:yes stop_codon:yes gene_type:complete
MNFEIKNLSPDNYEPVIDFYSKYGDRSFSWYEKKLKKEIMSGNIVGKVCFDNEKVIGAYLGRIQTLLCSPSLKAIQSIDTLIAPSHRGGKILIRLAKEFYQFLKLNSYDVVYGLPNKKIEKFRYKFLNWKLLAPTYSFTVFIPIFLLRFIYYFFRFFLKKRMFFDYKNEKENLIKNKLTIKNYTHENLAHGIYWINGQNNYFTFIGLFRIEKNLNIFQKFLALLVASSNSKGYFLKTYSTSNSETADIFKPFSIKKKALNFSGCFLTNRAEILLKGSSFEFVEFDTFGLL